MKVLFVFAHPDDETFSSGGTIVKLVKSGVIVKLITATRGEAGQFGNPPVATKENVGQVREKELKAAAKILGISKIYFLDFIDGTLKKVGSSKIAAKIIPILKKENPDIVITFDKTGGSNHPDHIVISKAANSAFYDYMKKTKKYIRLYHTANPRSNVLKFQKAGLSYSAFGKIEGTPDEVITTVIDVSKTLKTKIKALKMHRTQNQDWERYLKRVKLTDLKSEFFQLISENNLF